MTPTKAEMLREALEDLRWNADRIVTNHFGERVWLTHCAGGITDCCAENSPCDYHAALTNQASGTLQ